MFLSSLGGLQGQEIQHLEYAPCDKNDLRTPDQHRLPVTKLRCLHAPKREILTRTDMMGTHQKALPASSPGLWQ